MCQRRSVPDLRFAVRSFARQPGGTALIVGTLAIAIAANTAVFSLVDAVFFRQPPYPNASRLVDLNEQAPTWNLEFTGVSYADFDVWRRTTRTFEGMALWEETSANFSDGAAPTLRLAESAPASSGNASSRAV